MVIQGSSLRLIRKAVVGYHQSLALVCSYHVLPPAVASSHRLELLVRHIGNSPLFVGKCFLE